MKLKLEQTTKAQRGSRVIEFKCNGILTTSTLIPNAEVKGKIPPRTGHEGPEGK
jgi:hypothetical protein